MRPCVSQTAPRNSSGVCPSGSGKRYHPQFDIVFALSEKVCNPLISNPKANSPLPTCVGPGRLRSRISGLCRVTTARRSIPRAAAGCHDKSRQRARRLIAAAVRRERKGRMRFFIAFFGLRHGSPGSDGYASAERNHGPAGFPSYKIIRYFPNSGSGI